MFTDTEVDQMGRKRNQAYTEEFLKEAVKRSEQTGVTQAEVAEELGLSSQQIANWKRQFTRLSDKQFNTVDGVDYSKKESEKAGDSNVRISVCKRRWTS
jgi:transposase